MAVSVQPATRRSMRRWRWFVPGLGVKRYVLLLSLGLMVLVVGFTQFAQFLARPMDHVVVEKAHGA